MIDFANQLRKDFSRFTGNNPNLTLSAGLSLARHREPVFRAAEFAEDALEKAKKASKKNSFQILGESIPWDSFERFFREAQQLARWQKDGIANSAFIYRLLAYRNILGKWLDEKNPEGLRYLPLLSYDITRNLDKRERQDIKQWAEQLKLLDNESLEYLSFIAKYSLYANR